MIKYNKCISDNNLFNRAKLLNVGYKESISRGDYDCFAFHDIDMLPEDDRHLYYCSDQPRHLVVACSNNNYKYIKIVCCL